MEHELTKHGLSAFQRDRFVAPPDADYRAASAAMWPAKLVTKVLRLVMPLTSENLPVVMAFDDEAMTAVVV